MLLILCYKFTGKYVSLNSCGEWVKYQCWSLFALSSVLDNLFVQFSSVAQSCPTLCDPMNRSTPGLPVYHQLPEFTQTHVHWASDAIQPSHPLSSPSPPAPNPSQHQDLFQWVSSLHEVAKVLEFQLKQFSECWELSQLFHSPLSLSSRGFLVPLHFLTQGWCHVHIWGCWYFSWQSWFQLVFLPVQRYSWCTLHIT